MGSGGRGRGGRRGRRGVAVERDGEGMGWEGREGERGGEKGVEAELKKYVNF